MSWQKVGNDKDSTAPHRLSNATGLATGAPRAPGCDVTIPGLWEGKFSNNVSHL